MPSKNIVFIGAERATVIAGTDTTLSVIAPYGAVPGPITVTDTVTSQMAFQQSIFLPKFDNSSYGSGFHFSAPAEIARPVFLGKIRIADLNNDGKPDLLVQSRFANLLFLYKNVSTSGVISSSSFLLQDSISAYMNGDIKTVDMDRDGKLDIVTSNGISKNNSSATAFSFSSPVSISSSPLSIYKIEIADMDNNGLPDIVTNGSGGFICIPNLSLPGQIALGNAGFVANIASVSSVALIKVADIDGDFKDDIIVADGTANISVFRNQTLAGNYWNFTFASPVSFSSIRTTAMEVVDMDGDGKTDIVCSGLTSGYNSAISVLRNTSTAGVINSGSFAGHIDTVFTYPTEGLAVGDIDGDGKPDIATTMTYDSSLVIWQNLSSPSSIVLGSGIKANYLHATIADIKVADLNGDGPPEIILTRTDSNRIRIYQNNPLPQIAGNRTVCRGANDTLANGWTGGTWSSSDTSTASVSSTGVVTGIRAGVAVIRYTLGTAWDTAQVTVISPTGSITSTAALVCLGNSAALTAGGGLSYTWSPSSGLSATTGSTVTASPTVTTTYIASGPTSSGCTVYDTVTIAVTLPPIAAISMVNVPCEGHSATIVFSGNAGDTISYRVDSGTYVDAILGLAGTDTLFTGATTGTHTYLLHNVRNSGCANTLDTTAVVTSLQMTWTGTTSTNWNTAANWNCGTVPVVTDNVLIPAGTAYQPLLSPGTGGYAHNLSVATGVNITNRAMLTVSGNLALYGSISDTGTAKLAGSAPQVISGAGRINRLLIENSAGVRIDTGARLTITDALGINSGTLNTGDSLYLFSDSLASARVTALPAAAAIVGNVRVMQFIPGGMRRYRFWSHPFSGSIGLEQMQQFIDVTGPGGTANGFTTTASNSPSAFRYDPFSGNSSLGYDPGWKPFTSTYTTADSNRLHRFQGVRVFIRGAKGEGLGYGSYSPSPVTVTQWGALNQGRILIPLSKGSSTNQDYNMVGNPYPSPVDVGTVCYNARISGNLVGGAYYVWNPSLGAAGQFQAIPISTTTASPYYLPANSSFQVRAAHNGDSLVFVESNKGATPSASLFRQSNEGLRLVVYDAQHKPYDILDFNFNEQAGDEDDNMNDARKLIGPGLNLYSLAADKRKLAIDVRAFKPEQIIPLGISNAAQMEYVIKAEWLNTLVDKKLYLHDKLLDQYVLLQTGTEYRFSVSADTATQGDDRFELAMTPETAARKALTVWMVPNPANEEVTVNWMNRRPEQINIRLLNLSGVCVYSRTAGSQMVGAKHINLDRLASGIYIMELTTGNEKVVLRLVKE